uniref:Bestrophin homolog n=1 Tax=Echinostoma caproni TaxID=27848 RepID=A0A183AZH6_9TREM
LTCPLEVVKVRLQSSQGVALRSAPQIVLEKSKSTTNIARSMWSTTSSNPVTTQSASLEHAHVCFQCDINKYPFSESPTWLRSRHSLTPINSHSASVASSTEFPIKPNTTRLPNTGVRRSVLIRCLVDIFRDEGYSALFKGLLPTLIVYTVAFGKVIYNRKYSFYRDPNTVFTFNYTILVAGLHPTSEALTGLVDHWWFTLESWLKTLILNQPRGGVRITLSRLFQWSPARLDIDVYWASWTFDSVPKAYDSINLAPIPNE